MSEKKWREAPIFLNILCENKYAEKKLGAKRPKFLGILCENNSPPHIQDSQIFMKISSPLKVVLKGG